MPDKETGEVAEWHTVISQSCPVASVEIYHGGAIVKRKRRGKMQGRPPENNRVTRLSKKSLSRLAFTASTSPVKYKSMLTLTFLEIETSGRKVKSMLNSFLTRLRYHLKERKPEYIWFLEFQERGAPHFHVLLNVLYSAALHDWIAKTWARIVGDETGKVEAVHRHIKTFELLRSEGGAIGYCLAYAMKPKQKVVPPRYRDVGRFWGASRGNKAEPVAEVELDEDELRERLEAVRPGFNDSMPHFVPKYVILG